MNTEFVLKEYYVRYLRYVRKLFESSIKHYIDALNNISRYLVKNNKIVKMIERITRLEHSGIRISKCEFVVITI